MNKKDRECIKRTGFPCVRIPQSLYDAAEREGYDLSGYVVVEMMPTWRDTPRKHLSAAAEISVHNIRTRQHLSERQCSGKEIACMPGKSGKCVACGEDD